MRWASRLMAIMLVVGVADGLVVLFAPRPLPWAAMIPALIPLLTVVFVCVPLLNARKAAH